MRRGNREERREGAGGREQGGEKGRTGRGGRREKGGEEGEQGEENGTEQERRRKRAGGEEGESGGAGRRERTKGEEGGGRQPLSKSNVCSIMSFPPKEGNSWSSRIIPYFSIRLKYGVIRDDQKQPKVKFETASVIAPQPLLKPLQAKQGHQTQREVCEPAPSASQGVFISIFQSKVRMLW